MTLAALGGALGVAMAVAASRLLDGLVFGLTPLDVPTYGGVVVLFALVAAVATYLPARRATRINPIIALRSE
jgi:ABC-type antimicrobial peptide transport system permease subunit